MTESVPPTGEVLLYQTQDGKTRLDVRFQGETVWLTQEQMAALFERDRSVITRHIANVFSEGELAEESNVHFLHFPHSDKPVRHYSLDVIISVGYRVKSARGTQFRIWATQRLRDYVVKGFALDAQRFKEPGGDRYFDELLDAIRDIRTSERMFYQKVKDIYATSSDYDPNVELTAKFFAAVQNKLHFAVHGHTAAELVYERADARKRNMGLTNFPGTRVLSKDVPVAKNYLNQRELSDLGLLVEQYLAFAELQARRRVLMTMRDWAARLDEVLRMNGMEILTHAGRIAQKLAAEKAQAEYESFREQRRLTGELERDMQDANALAKTADGLPKPPRVIKKKKPA